MRSLKNSQDKTRNLSIRMKNKKKSILYCWLQMSLIKLKEYGKLKIQYMCFPSRSGGDVCLSVCLACRRFGVRISVVTKVSRLDRLYSDCSTIRSAIGVGVLDDDH